jgi:hypothetical protein
MQFQLKRGLEEELESFFLSLDATKPKEKKRELQK